MRTRIKVCGITRPEDGLAAARAGADAIGLVFYARSPRAVGVAQARAIIAVLPPFVTTVGQFVDATREFVSDTLRQVPLDLLQFHGDESPEYCSSFARPYLKAIRMRPETDLYQLDRQYESAAALLLDAYTPGTPGGTGERFDWQQIPADLASGLVLAGGLDASNVAEAITRVNPYGVDVSSGVESAKGIKDLAKVQTFIAAAGCADTLLAQPS